VSVDDLFDDTPKGKYWYRNGFNPKAIAALLPSVALGWSSALFRPCMKWRTSAGLSASSSAACLPLAGARRARSAGATAFRSGAVAQKE
jgi:NCS1 family nucleobase:cation symporter-1